MITSDHQLDALIAAATPITVREVAQMSLDVAEETLRGAILAMPRSASAGATIARMPRAPRTVLASLLGHSPRRRWITVLAASGVAAAGAAIGVARLGGGPERAWAAEIVKIAEASPRYLLEGEWRVTRADQLDTKQGEMTFTSGARTFDLHWREGSYRQWVSDRAKSADLSRTATVLGATASLFKYAGGNSYTVLWARGASTIEFDGVARTLAEFESIVGRLHEVDVDTWLTAMPKSVVKPSARSTAVTAMLVGLPIPPALDIEALETRTELKDRYQLGAEVTGAVACGWIVQWLNARRRDDPAAAQAAAAALATSTRWPILTEMARDGAWPSVLREYADVVNGAAPPSKGLTRERWLATASSGLGCSEIPSP